VPPLINGKTLKKEEISSVNFLMNYIVSKNLKKHLTKATKSLFVVCAIFLVFTVIFYSPRSTSATFYSCSVNPTDPACLPSCDSIILPNIPDVGVNCLYLNLPICTSKDTVEVTDATILANPKPRENCADLIDMPLCSDIASPDPLKNCVPECSTILEDNTKIRGIDYAVHNKDCVRFCGSLSDGNANTENLNDLTIDPSGTYAQLVESKRCVANRCHQVPDGYTGSGSCNLLSCKLLTTDELNNNKFSTTPFKQFCDGSNVKCYEFEQNKLQYLIAGGTPYPMCQIHNCQLQPQPTSTICTGGVVEDVDTIISKGNAYVQEYERTIVGIGTDGDTDPSNDEAPAVLNPPDNSEVKAQLDRVCNQLTTSCLTIAKRSFRCTPEENECPANCPTTLNANCTVTATVPGYIPSCDSEGFCKKAIDCNATPTEPECLPAPAGDEGESEISPSDPDSWFYKPKPMDKAMHNHRIRDMQSDLCYSLSDLKSQPGGWGWNGFIPTPFGKIPLGYFHSQYNPDESRSPGFCKNVNGVTTSRDGFRGTGYLYLCGNEGNINAKVSDYTAFHNGIPVTTFTNDDSITDVRLCLRFKNAVRPSDITGDSETCGRRECALSCAFDICRSQLCGYDVCRTVTVKESEATDCIFNTSMFDHPAAIGASSGKPCAKIVDDYLRLRAVQYGNRICTFLDVKGQFAYNKNLFLRGNETLSDGTCLAESSGDGCNGKDSTDSHSIATKWRATLRIPYVKHDGSDNDYRGYIFEDGSADGILIKEQECIKVPLRVRPMRMYNLATKENSFKLFHPPLYISDSFVEKGGAASPSTSLDEDFGPTDFNYPEIEVTYGDSTVVKLNLSIDVLTTPETTISTTFNEIDYTTKIFAQKEFVEDNATPYFCLYQIITDTTGNDQNIQLGCVRRNLPEIDNGSTRKVLISTPTSPVNKYDNAKITLQYQGNASETSTLITLGNTIQSTPECFTDTEEYKICAQREQCTMLTTECVQNEIAIQNSVFGADISSLLSMRDYCNNSLNPLCKQKQGTFTDVNNIDYTLSNAYGWFNEICISSGFETKLQDIIAYRVYDQNNNPTSIKGKCVIDVVASTGACTDGGKPATGGVGDNCICLKYIDDITTPVAANQIVRKQTAREAGLCSDIPTPQLCPAISYATNAERTAGTASGHAEFPNAFGGMTGVIGSCIGNWKNVTSGGVNLNPLLSCYRNSDDTVYWGTIENSCVRYSCPQILTKSSYNSGIINYTNSYVKQGEAEAEKGLGNGYATWPSKTSSDADQAVSATGCITGFEANGSYPTRNCSPQGVWKDLANICVRKTCSKLNYISDAPQSDDPASAWDTAWNNPSNSLNPSNFTPGSSGWNDVWDKWHNAGGAMFPEALASRYALLSPSDPVMDESRKIGECNMSLGYKELDPTHKPTMKCDENGAWVGLENPCVTSCTKIDTSGYVADGNAYWEEGSIPFGENESDGTLTTTPAPENQAYNSGCISGYQHYPYAPLKDKYGNYINCVTEDNTSVTCAAQEIATPNGNYKKLYKKDTGPNALPELSPPHRICSNSEYNGIISGTWGYTYAACTNKCPGAATDPRIGVGITKHRLSNGTDVYLSWSDASPGEEQVIFSPDTSYQTPSSTHYSKDYYLNNPNVEYVVKRVCGNDLKWVSYDADNNPATPDETVKPQCSGDGTYEFPSEHVTLSGGTTPNPTVNESAVLAANCVYGYDSQTTKPQYTCQAKDSNRYIDQFYYNKTGGGVCEIVCTPPAVNTPFGSGSKYVSGASGNYFDGETISLHCRSGYGKEFDGDTSNSDNSCGRANEYRTNVSPSVTCSSGVWGSISQDCDACAQCKCTSSDCSSKGGGAPAHSGKPYSFIKSTTNQIKVKLCTYGDHTGKGNNDDDVFLAGPYTRGDVDCGNSGDHEYNLYPGTVPSYPDANYIEYKNASGHSSNYVKYSFSCYDGLFVVRQTENSGHTSDMHVLDY
jgi:hypothetical protein